MMKVAAAEKNCHQKYRTVYSFNLLLHDDTTFLVHRSNTQRRPLYLCLHSDFQSPASRLAKTSGVPYFRKG